MRSLVGLLWALGGGIAGLIVGLVGASVFAGVTNMTSREGASGYFAISIGLIGALIGLIVGLVMYARSAPVGHRVAYIGSGTLGFVALIAAVAVFIWAFMQLREAPLVVSVSPTRVSGRPSLGSVIVSASSYLMNHTTCVLEKCPDRCDIAGGQTPRPLL